MTYHQASDISRTLVDNTIVDHSDIHSRLDTWDQWNVQRQLQDNASNLKVWGFDASNTSGMTIHAHGVDKIL